MAKAENLPAKKAFSSKLLQMKFMQRRGAQQAAAEQLEQATASLIFACSLVSYRLCSVQPTT